MLAEDLKNDAYPRVEDYGVIGDLATTALIGNKGSIDCLCWPEFDSPSIFAAHVDRKKGGRFQICPDLPDMREKKIYLPDTNVLLSRFLAENGIAEVSDFMLCENGNARQALVRRAKAVQGDIKFAVLCEPQFDYARALMQVEQSNGIIFFAHRERDGLVMRLTSSVSLSASGQAGFAEFVVPQGEHAWFVLEESSDRDTPTPPTKCFVSDAFKRTVNFWRNWIAKSQYQGRWREAVNRSALTLKLLTSRKYGSIVAAPCFGFPCEIGGERNWDYRFTWIRDAAFTLYGLMRLGFTEEAAGFMTWLQNRCAELDDWGGLDIMYHVDGSRVTDETTLDHLEGYKQSRPIRIGSTNIDQLQLDIFGELMDSIYLYDKYGTPMSYDTWNHLCRMVEFVVENWDQPDASIWEARGATRKFLYSRVMCWVAIDRAIRLARKRSLPAPLSQWEKTRDQIYHAVHNNLWNNERQAFGQSEGSSAMDASALVMPLVKFISPTDPKWLSTMQAINQDLVTDSLVYRYQVNEAFPDGLQGKDGTFTLCSFWLIECTARTGDLKSARYLFEKILSYGNDVGLFSEQLAQTGEFLGNIPQAFTHLSMISAAFDLDRRLDNKMGTGQ